MESAAAKPIVERLQSDRGFPYSLRPSREDRLARQAAMMYFGEQKVSNILSVLHRSKISYDAIIEDLMKYNHPRARHLRDEPSYQMSIQSVREDLLSGLKTKLIPYTTGAVPKLPDFPGAKSPGLPWKLEGFKTKREVADVPENIAQNRRTWHLIGAGVNVPLPDACLFARPQIAKTDTEKIRAVWGYPFDVYIEEARFFYPIQDYIKDRQHSLPIAYGFEMANGGMQVVNEMCGRNKHSKFCVLDWKSFDKTVQPWIIRDAFNILAELVDFGKVVDSEGIVWRVRADRSIRRWKRLVNYFINTPVRSCKGERFLVHGGVPSGSCFTNLIDSIINLIVLRYLNYECTGKFPDDELVLGDDAIVVTTGVINLEDWAELAKVKFSMILNVSKSYVTTDPRNVHFLGHFNMLGIPFKNQDFLIASFIQPEYTRRSAAEAAAAALGQLWSCFDPVYASVWYKIINFCADYDDLTSNEVVLHLRHSYYRHKYLAHVGIDARKITLPAPSPEGLILEVLPPLSCTNQLPKRKYDYNKLWQATKAYWYAPDTGYNTDEEN